MQASVVYKYKNIAMLCYSTSTAPTHLWRVEPIVSGLLLGLWPCATRYRLFGYAVRAPADSRK